MALFQVQGFVVNPIKLILTGTSANVITTGSLKTVTVPYFRVSEYGGGTPNVTVEIYNTVSTVSYYLGSGGSTWKAKAVTALQSLLFDDGYDLDLNDQLRITASSANTILVTGLYFGKQSATPWTPVGRGGPASGGTG
jgi:hypothetical protein